MKRFHFILLFFAFFLTIFLTPSMRIAANEFTSYGYSILSNELERDIYNFIDLSLTEWVSGNDYKQDYTDENHYVEFQYPLEEEISIDPDNERYWNELGGCSSVGSIFLNEGACHH